METFQQIFDINKDDNLREKILNDFKSDNYFEDAKIVEPGFLNLKFSKEFYKFFSKNY